MANTIKVVNGFYTECDEYDNTIHTYWELGVDQVKQISFSGNRIVAFMQDNSLIELEDRCLKSRSYCYPFHPDYFQSIQLVDNTITIKSTNNETYKCDFGTSGAFWDRVWD